MEKNFFKASWQSSREFLALFMLHSDCTSSAKKCVVKSEENKGSRACRGTVPYREQVAIRICTVSRHHGSEWYAVHSRAWRKMNKKHAR
jgi:hypothetical protein